MGAMRESCSVCGTSFDVQFRYQMEERNGGFSFYCSQKCLQHSQKAGSEDAVNCDACAKRFRVSLVSQVLYLGSRRKYACTLDCREQLIAEARGVRLGDLVNGVPASPPSSEPPRVPSSVNTTVSPSVAKVSLPPIIGAPSTATTTPASAAPAVAIPVVPNIKNMPLRPATVTGGNRAASPQRTSTPPPSSAGTDQPRTIAIFNHKGGTGKTTTSVTIAAGLAQKGKKVLLVDTDAQGNVGVSLNVKVEKSLYHVLVMGLSGKDATINVRPNLDLIPSNETLASAELYLAGRQNRDRVLAGRLASTISQYDYVIVDCSPSLSLLNQNALCLVDSVLIPVACDYLSLVGTRQVIKTVKNVNQLLHHPVRIWGVLPTFYESRAKICNEALDHLRQHFGSRCLKPIRQAVRIKEAPSKGQTLFECAAGTTAVEDYLHVIGCISGEIPLESNLVIPQQEPESSAAAIA